MLDGWMDLYTEQIQISSIFDYICILRITVMLSFIALLTLGRVAQGAQNPLNGVPMHAQDSHRILSGDSDSFGYHNGCSTSFTTTSYHLYPGEIINLDASASCELGYLYMWVFDDGWNTLCWSVSYNSVSVSCTIGSTLYNGDYHYYTYWASTNWSHYGYLYDYDEFVVTNGTDRDMSGPWGEATFAKPFYGTLNVSGSSSDKVVALLSARESSSGYQTGVDFVNADIYDNRWNWIGGSTYHLDSGNEFEGVWAADVAVVSSSAMNGHANLYYNGADKFGNYFSGYTAHSLDIVGGQDPDYTGPVFSNVTFSTSNAVVGDNLTVTMIISDPESGVNYAYCYMYDTTYWYGTSVFLELVSGDSKEGLYTFSYTLGRVGTFQGYCYAYNNEWVYGSSDTYTLTVSNTVTPSASPTAAPTVPSTLTPTIPSNFTHSNGTDTVTVTITITMDVSITVSSTSRRLLEGEELTSLRKALLFVIYNSLQSRLSFTNLNAVDIIKLQNVSEHENAENDIIVAKLNMTASNTTADAVYVYCKQLLEGLSPREMNDMAIFLMQYYNQRYAGPTSSMSSVSMTPPSVVSGYTSTTSGESSASCPSSSPEETAESSSDNNSTSLTIGGAVGIGVASSFVSFCLIYLVVNKYTKRIATKKLEDTNNPIPFATNDEI